MIYALTWRGRWAEFVKRNAMILSLYRQKYIEDGRAEPRLLNSRRFLLNSYNDILEEIIDIRIKRKLELSSMMQTQNRARRICLAASCFHGWHDEGGGEQSGLVVLTPLWALGWWLPYVIAQFAGGDRHGYRDPSRGKV